MSIRLAAVAAVALTLPLCGCVSTRAPTAAIAVVDPSPSARTPTMAPDPGTDGDPSAWRLRLTRL